MSDSVFTMPNATSLAVEPLQKLVYSNVTQNPLTNLLLVSTDVEEYHQFIDSANQNTFVVAYSRMSSKTELMELLRSKTQSLKRIGFVFHSPGNNEKVFLDGKSLFLANDSDNSDNSDNSHDYSENLQWLLDIISEFSVKNVDFLACDTLNSDLWKSYYSFLTEKTGITVGASNTKTGNSKYGGNWIMESTGEDVEKVYFTESIEYYKYLLATIDPVDGVTYSQIGTTPNATVSSANSGTILANTTILASVTDTDGAVYIVVSINSNAFADFINLTSVFIPSSITTFGDQVFSGCSGLKSVNLQTGLTVIGDDAFNSCTGLTSVSIPASITTFGSFAFYNCDGLTSVNLQTGLTVIGDFAFGSCTSLTSVTIPSSITTFGDQVFSGCSGLKSVNLQTGLQTISMLAFFYCTGLTSVSIPSTVTTFGDQAFASCTGLTNVTLEPGLQIIGNYAFEGCPGLTSVSIPSTVTTFGTGALGSCTGLTSLTVDPGNTNYSAESNVLYNKLETELVCYPAGLTTPFTIPSSVTSIYSGAFSGSQISSIIIPSTITTFGNKAFYSCTGLTSVSIPASITTFGNQSFFSCTGLTSVNLETGLQIIGVEAFQSCIGLTSVSIPNSVTTVGGGAFYNCTSLTSVYFDSLTNLPSLGSNCFLQNLDLRTNTAYYYNGVKDSNGNFIPNYYTYFQSFGFLDAVGQDPPIPCFKEGSRILTKNGYLRIQDLKKGDLIKTVLNNYVPVAMIGKRDIYHPAKKDRIKDQLYKCTSEKYPEVFEELVITGCHSILVDKFINEEQREKTIEVNKIIYVTDKKYRLPACADNRASVYEKPGNYTIYHLALENADYYMNYGIYANGLLVETCSKRYLKEISNMTLID